MAGAFCHWRTYLVIYRWPCFRASSDSRAGIAIRGVWHTDCLLDIVMFSTDPLESAAEAGLRYTSCSGLSIRRVRWGKSFRYFDSDGKPVRDPKQIGRIRALVIPPAWTDVRICSMSNGHLQAVGWDARGRKQYRYHPRYRAVRDQAKFSRMIAFGAVLAIIRQRVRQDLELSGLPKQKVLATVVRLLETSFIRVGNDEYARENDSLVSQP